MRAIPRWLAVLACGAAALIVGCGSSAPTGPRSVQVSLIAPSDGATVQVPLIFVYGTVQPANAVVLLDGKRIPVSHGTFRQPYRLSGKLTRIRLVARAHGYVHQRMDVRIAYKPRPRAGGGSAVASSGRAVSGGAAASKPGGTYYGPGSGGYTGGGSGNGSYTPVEASFVGGCTNQGGSVGGCQCVWRHLQAGGFANVSAWRSLILSWRRSFRASGTITYPAVFRSAIFSCASALQARY